MADMTDAAQPLPKKRRSPQEQKDHLASKIKAIDQEIQVRIKRRLEEAKKELEALAMSASGKPYAPKIGQAASLLSQAAQEVRIEQ